MKRQRVAIVVEGNKFPIDFYRKLSVQHIPDYLSFAFFVVTTKSPKKETINELKRLGFNFYIEENKDGNTPIETWLETFHIDKYNCFLFMNDSLAADAKAIEDNTYVADFAVSVNQR